MKNYFAACALVLSLAPMAHAASLVSISSNGSGCPIQDGKQAPYGFNGEWLTIELNKAFDINVRKGQGISLEESRKNCAYTLQIAAPGYRYAVERVIGWVDYQVGNGDQFVFDVDGFFAGGRTTFTALADTNGPANAQNFAYDRTLTGANLVWSSCSSDRALTLNSSVRVSPLSNGKRDTWSKGSLERLAYKFTFQKCD